MARNALQKGMLPAVARPRQEQRRAAAGPLAVRNPASLSKLGPHAIESGPSLRERIYSQTKAVILSGGIPPGRLVSVAQLAKEFNVSRTPVREALLELVSDGVLRPERNRGFRVVEYTREQIDQVFEVRLVLETYALSRAASLPQQPAVLAKARKLHAALERDIAKGDMVDFLLIDREFHLLLASLSRNDLLTSFVSSLRDHLRLPYLSALRETGQLQASLGDHSDLVDAIEAGDAGRVDKLVRLHLRRARIDLDQETSKDSRLLASRKRPHRAKNPSN